MLAYTKRLSLNFYFRRFRLATRWARPRSQYNRFLMISSLCLEHTGVFIPHLLLLIAGKSRDHEWSLLLLRDLPSIPPSPASPLCLSKSSDCSASAVRNCKGISHRRPTMAWRVAVASVLDVAPRDRRSRDRRKLMMVTTSKVRVEYNDPLVAAAVTAMVELRARID